MAGIYVHVPFCKAKCTYCDFASYPKEAGKADAYFACLYREMKGWREELAGKSFDTVYFGGGTPTFVAAPLIAGAMKQLRNCYRIAGDAEITIECNPGTLAAEKVSVYRAAGINRYSIGLQSGIDEQLRRLNRVHTAKDFLLACSLLKGENLSADILIGLAGQTQDDLKKTIDLALAGGVCHVSMYALTPEPGTPVYSDYLNGLLPDGDETADLYDFGREYLAAAGFARYEVSNFAQKGKESRPQSQLLAAGRVYRIRRFRVFLYRGTAVYEQLFGGRVHECRHLQQAPGNFQRNPFRKRMRNSSLSCWDFARRRASTSTNSTSVFPLILTENTGTN